MRVASDGFSFPCSNSLMKRYPTCDRRSSSRCVMPAARRTARMCAPKVESRFLTSAFVIGLCGVEQADDLRDGPHVVRHASFHRWRYAKRLMHPGEVVEHEVERDCCRVVLKLLAEGVRQPSESANAHAHREVLALDVAGRDVLRIRLTADDFCFASDAHGRAVPLLC